MLTAEAALEAWAVCRPQRYWVPAADVAECLPSIAAIVPRRPGVASDAETPTAEELGGNSPGNGDGDARVAPFLRMLATIDGEVHFLYFWRAFSAATRWVEDLDVMEHNALPELPVVEQIVAELDALRDKVLAQLEGQALEGQALDTEDARGPRETWRLSIAALIDILSNTADTSRVPTFWRSVAEVLSIDRINDLGMEELTILLLSWLHDAAAWHSETPLACPGTNLRTALLSPELSLGPEADYDGTVRESGQCTATATAVELPTAISSPAGRSPMDENAEECALLRSELRVADGGDQSDSPSRPLLPARSHPSPPRTRPALLEPSLPEPKRNSDAYEVNNRTALLPLGSAPTDETGLPLLYSRTAMLPYSPNLGTPAQVGGLPVLLHIYDVSQQDSIRRLNAVLAHRLSPLKFGGVFHAGVEVNGLEWSYGWTASLAVKGVHCTEPQRHPDHNFRQSVHMPPVVLSATDIAKVVSRLEEEYLGPEYDLLTRNCCHFADEFCQRLGVGQIPRWVYRLARIGARIDGVLQVRQNLRANPRRPSST
mmetsp:Transcript_37656/g.82683  ORF Transcript_37656/g.82683 Transcript_37656/m.82683 type:complete len:545 (-) Transcript_37656:168-1802(-)